MTELDKIVQDIAKLFTKQKNTLYAVRVIYEPYSDEVNIFFESHKIGFATTSEQVGRLNGSYRDKLMTIKQELHQRTKLTVTTN
ncbi:hypothetical protein [Leuconostoc citreum]|uniref:hypothetical protein n=1 Tax=Leuconostoc citreum TaxID=33964 RepID=UPI000BFEB657|nr:hypothetical protein [Leuconostoc citreum]